MVYDALTSPDGMKLTPAAWRRNPLILALSRRRDIHIPPPSDIARDATPARAIISHGILKAWCPDCVGSAEDIWRDPGVFYCMKCGNRGIGRSWRPVEFPDDLDTLAARLSVLPTEMQNWEPWGPPVDIEAMAAEWAEHAAVTIDPEHGLTSNEVAGADDPEIWTPPFIATTNSIIASVDCNAGYRGNLLWLRQFLPANPAAANYWLKSTGTDAGSWVDRASEVLAAIGFTPVNRAAPIYSTFAGAAAGASQFFRVNFATPIADAPTTALDWYGVMVRIETFPTYYFQITCDIINVNDLYVRIVIAGTPGSWRKIWHAGNLDALLRTGGTMSGPISFSDILEGIILSGGSHVRDDHTPTVGSMQILAFNGTLNIYNIAATLMASIKLATATFVGALVAPSATLSGALTAASATLSGALSAASATLSGALSAASAAITNNATVGGTLGVTGAQTNSSTITAAGTVQGTRMITTVSDGTTPPFTVNAAQANVPVPNLKSAKATDSDTLQGNAAAAFATSGHAHTDMARSVSITFSGNGSGSTRVVSLGVSWVPKMVIIQCVAGSVPFMGIHTGHDLIYLFPGTSVNNLAGFALGSGSFSIPGSSAFNGSGQDYRITAMG